MTQAVISGCLDQALIDCDYLDVQTWHDRPLQRELLVLFMAQARQTLERIKGAAASGGGGVDPIVEGLHALRGSASAIGATPLAEAAHRMENGLRSVPWPQTLAADRDDLDQLAGLVENTCCYAATIIAALEGAALAKPFGNG